MESRFNQYKANLRSYLRKRGAEIDVKRKSVKIDTETLNKKELEKLKELERWGYEVNKNKLPLPLFQKREPEVICEEESFISFADEIMRTYYE